MAQINHHEFNSILLTGVKVDAALVIVLEGRLEFVGAQLSMLEPMRNGFPFPPAPPLRGFVDFMASADVVFIVV